MKPKRSNKTNLSSNELMLLDFLATLGASPASGLSKESYSIHMNISYSHDLNLDQTTDLLEILIDKELVSKELSEIIVRNFDDKTQQQTFKKTKDFRYAITTKGGSEWSLERTPIWEKYCTDSGYYDDDGNEYFEVISINKEMAYECAKHVHQYKLYNFNIDDLEFTESPSCPLLYWKKFPYECSWKTIAYPTKYIDIVWEGFDETRSYWRTLAELQKFL